MKQNSEGGGAEEVGRRAEEDGRGAEEDGGRQRGRQNDGMSVISSSSNLI